jgi:uncharacterized membrane protein YphA (DoxX/SURF4 family)
MHFSSPEFVAAVRTVMALVFFTAGIAKLRAWSAFEGVVANYRLLPPVAVRPVAYLLPLVEVSLAVGVLAGVAYADWVAAALLTLFAFSMGINLVRGRTYIDCGCFNSALKQPLRWSLVARNAGMVLLLLSAAGAPTPLLSASLLLGSMSGIALFVVVQCANALLAIPALKATPRTFAGES